MSTKPAGVKEGLLGIAGLAVLVGAIVWGVSACSSDISNTSDTKFIQSLDHDGISHGIFEDINKLGHAVCADLTDKSPYTVVVLSVAHIESEKATVNTPAKNRFTLDESRMLVNDAIIAYCPNFSTSIN